MIVSREGSNVELLERVLASSGIAIDHRTLDTLDTDSSHPLVLVGEKNRDILDLLWEVRTAHPGRAVLAVGGEDDADFVSRALAIGADDAMSGAAVEQELAARWSALARRAMELLSIHADKHDAELTLEVTRALSSTLDSHEILYRVVCRTAEVIDVDRVSIVLRPEEDDSGEEDVGYVVVASDDASLTNLRLDLNKYPEIQQVLKTGEQLVIADVRTHPLLEVVRDDVAHAALSLYPIQWEGQVRGVLFVRARCALDGLTERQDRLCQMVASSAAMSLRNASVLQSLKDHTQQIKFERFEAERKLGELRRYADLFAAAADGIAAIDRNGALLFANPRAYSVLVSRRESLEGLNLKDLVHPEDAERRRTLWRRFAEGEFPSGVDLRLRTGSGEYVVCECSFAALDSEVSSILVTFRDVTAQRKTEAELVQTMEFLESLIHASVDGIVAGDMKGEIILFNQAAERITGHRAEEVVGKMSTRGLYPPGGAEEIMRRLRSDGYGGTGRLSPTQMEVLGANGERIPIRISAAIIYDRGKPSASFGIFTDLREKLRVEERLADAQQRLAETEKQALIAELAGTAAHELNQPLTAVMAYAELLTRKVQEGTSEHRAATTMVTEVERMAEIVKKIGTMTRYETKSYVGRQKILDIDRASDSIAPTSAENET